MKLKPCPNLILYSNTLQNIPHTNVCTIFVVMIYKLWCASDNNNNYLQ